MHMNRREFLQLLAVAAASGMALDSKSALAGNAPANFYDVPRHGNVCFLHFTDCHAQLLPVWFREPNVNLGVGAAAGKPPHLVGEQLLKHYGIKPGTRRGARLHLSRLHRGGARSTARSAASRTSRRWSTSCARSARGALLLDGGDTWQGSATSLWTQRRRTWSTPA